MRILVTNDDGIYAPGIRTLAHTLAVRGEVIVFAPDQERSGAGHGITVNHPLRLAEVSVIDGIHSCYMVDGTPADCVKIAVQGLGVQPDLVISGINIGANLGTDVLYSGTVSAAIEGVMLGVPSVAVSLCASSVEYLDTAAFYLDRLLFELDPPQPADGLLNVNVPALKRTQVRGFRATKLGSRFYDNVFERRTDLRGRDYFWMGGDPRPQQSTDEEDDRAVDEGYVSVTPIHFDLTYHTLLDRLRAKIES